MGGHWRNKNSFNDKVYLVDFVDIDEQIKYLEN
jgi:hypothetical protein